MAESIKLYTTLNLLFFNTAFRTYSSSSADISMSCRKKKKKGNICYLNVSVIRHTKNLRKHKHHSSVLYCKSTKENHTKPRKSYKFKGWENTGVLLFISVSERDLKRELLMQRKLNCNWTLNQAGSFRAWVQASVLLLAHQGLHPYPSSHKAWWHLVPKQHTTTKHTPKIFWVCFMYPWPCIGVEVFPLFLHLALTQSILHSPFLKSAQTVPGIAFLLQFLVGLGLDVGAATPTTQVLIRIVKHDISPANSPSVHPGPVYILK